MAIRVRSVEQSFSLSDFALFFLRIGTIGFGGGMAIIAFIEREFVRRRRVMDANEFLRGVGIGQVLGPFAGSEGAARPETAPRVRTVGRIELPGIRPAWLSP